MYISSFLIKKVEGTVFKKKKKNVFYQFTIFGRNTTCDIFAYIYVFRYLFLIISNTHAMNAHTVRM